MPTTSWAIAHDNEAHQRGDLLPELPALLTERAERVLAIAVQSGVDDLVLGAWGCGGVFGNSVRLTV